MPGLGFPFAGPFGGDPVDIVTDGTAVAIPQGRDILLDQLTGDWALVEGDLVFVADAAAIAQDARQALHMYLGEWFLDEQEGLDWFGVVLIKNPSLTVIREAVRDILASVPGVKSVDILTVTLTAATRTLDIRFSATSDTGTVVTDTIALGG